MNGLENIGRSLLWKNLTAKLFADIKKMRDPGGFCNHQDPALFAFQ
jgi:hypothetical protein